MYRLYGNSLKDQARAHHLPVILPGEPEPVWLRHKAELHAALDEIRASKAENKAAAAMRRGIVTRLRVALRLG
ncbi:MAG: hypothetical protein ACRDG3_04865 [Tepidiformaceae bacterium]